MSFSELTNILNWWYVIFVIGLIFLPLTIFIFHNFLDLGYIFSKILGLLILSYAIWILSSLKILPFNTFNLLTLGGSFLVINLYILFKKNLLKIIRKHWRIFLFEEVLFLGGLIFWSYIRAHEPSIHGLEKFMDFGFINSILRTEFFPPKDLWLSPETLNYYYFGHLLVAVLTKLSFLNPVITYNLMVATLFGFTFTMSFSIGANAYHKFFASQSLPFTLKRALMCGLLAAFLVSMAGNLHTIYVFFQNYNTDNPVPFWQLTPQNNFSGYWYPNATRFIPFTIHEFPIYSFVVSDLHGHVLDIPVVLLTLMLIISIYFQKKINFGYIVLYGFLVGIMLMTNVLDGPIYLLLLALIVYFKERSNLLKYLLLTLLLAVVFSLPFWLSFKPFGSGIGVLCAPNFLTDIGKLGPILFEKDHCGRSPLWMLSVLYGFFYFTLYGFAAKIGKKISLTDKLVLILVLFATVLIIIPEIVYVKDIYPAHYRANTVFKFGFQAFMVLALSSSYMIFRIYTQVKWKFPIILYSFFILLFFGLVAIYPYFTIRSYYGNLNEYKGLDGLNYLQNLYPSDYKAILWIKEFIIGQPTILEGVGESYTDYARVSSNTGLPTVIGWPVHEWLWRGSPDEGTRRLEDVKLIYEDPDLTKTAALLKKYQISLIFLGTLEKQKYPKLLEEKFSKIGQIIFQDGETKIYLIN